MIAWTPARLTRVPVNTEGRNIATTCPSIAQAVTSSPNPCIACMLIGAAVIIIVITAYDIAAAATAITYGGWARMRRRGRSAPSAVRSAGPASR